MPAVAGFPRSLQAAPFLLPAGHVTVRRALDQWFNAARVRPTVVAEFDDSALMYSFGEEGQGIFPSPTVFEAEFRRLYNVEVVGHVKNVRQQFYAISVDRRNPAPGGAGHHQGSAPGDFQLSLASRSVMDLVP